MATVIRVSLAQIQTRCPIDVLVDQTEYQFWIGPSQSWFQPQGRVAIAMIDSAGECWLPWPAPHDPIKWASPPGHGPQGEIVFCLEGATEASVAAEPKGVAEYNYFR